MRKRAVSVLLTVFLVLSIVPTAFAANDTTAPVLNGVTLNAKAFNQNDTLTVTVDASASSGFDLTKCYISFYSIFDEPANVCTPIFVRLDKACDGGIQGSILLNEYVRDTYEILSVYLVDSNGNKSEYQRNYGNTPDVSFTLISNYTAPPVGGTPKEPLVTSLTISKQTAYVGDTVTMTLTTKDSVGVEFASMQMMPESVAWQDFVPYDVVLFPVENSPGTFTGTFTITTDTPQSTYSECNVIVMSSDGRVTRYMDLCGDENWSGSHKVLNVINPAYKEIDPTLTAFSMSTHNVTQGEKIKITAAMCKGSEKIYELAFSIYNRNTHELYKGFSIFRQPDGTFSGTVTIPFELEGGDCVLTVGGFTYKGGQRQNGGGIISVASYLKTPIKIGQQSTWYLSGGEFTVTPALTISGIDNKTIMEGDSFDAMQGVNAKDSTGDITGKITVNGDGFDTKVPGVYLLKYNIRDKITVDGTDYTINNSYSRFIGVTKVTPQATVKNGEYPLALTGGDLAVGTADSDIWVDKGGINYKYNKVITEPGEYTFSSIRVLMSSSNGTESINENIGKNAVEAVIDKSRPDLCASWQKDPSSKLVYVFLKARDISGVSEIKYMSGDQTIETCKGNGTTYTGAFTIPAYGKLTVYTLDNLGNEGIQVININKKCSNSYYLWGVNISVGNLSSEFKSSRYKYTLSLGENEESVTLTPVKECDAAVMKINGIIQDSLKINVGNNKTKVVTIKVSFAGKTKTYKFNIVRAKSTKNNLTSLTAVSNGVSVPFSESFNPYNLNYSLKLDRSTKSVKITDTVSPYAKSTFSSKTFTLKNGETKVINLTVTSQSGGKKIYTITITRDK